MLFGRKYRTDLGLRISSGILFNHESHLRKPSYLTHKVISTALKIKRGQPLKLEIGDPSMQVDWGYAKDFVRAFQLINRKAKPDDYIVSTGIRHTALEFINLVFNELDLNYQDHLVVNSSVLKNRTEFGVSLPLKLNKETGWSPSLSFEDLASQLIVDYMESEKQHLHK